MSSRARQFPSPPRPLHTTPDRIGMRFLVGGGLSAIGLAWSRSALVGSHSGHKRKAGFWRNKRWFSRNPMRGRFQCKAAAQPSHVKALLNGDFRPEVEGRMRHGSLPHSTIQSVPQGLSITKRHVPSAWRRRTSALCPVSFTGSPSAPVPLNDHTPATRARSLA